MKKLALIGCGLIGNYHLEHFLDFDDIEVVGFCDLIAERAESFAKRVPDAKAYTDFRRMFDETEPDMLFIGIPPDQHGEIEFEAIRRRIPFFVEKPLALDLDLARRINAAVEEAGLITACGFQVRYSSLVEPNRRFIRENEVVFIDCLRMGGIPGAPWWTDKARSGGQIVEQTIHQFDIIRYLFDEPVEVFTYGTRGFVKGVPGYDTDDLTTTVVRFRGGALGTLSTGCYATGGDAVDNKLTFSARDCRAELRILTDLRLVGTAAAGAARRDGGEGDGDGSDEGGGEGGSGGLVVKGDGAMYASGDGGVLLRETNKAGILCDRTFIDAVISGDGSKIRSPYADALKSLEFTLACNRSMETGQPVKLNLG
ncbi:MAG: Gfo/Idh/MocA family oxidoreductase [Bacillota bacterium]|nr:Gfo/Idh/MocA family oxidoreductase [Bacillota bacterium]